MRKIGLLAIMLSLLVMLTACKEDGISFKEAEKSIEEMMLCLSEERYTDAAALCHPDAKITSEGLEDYIAQLEEEDKVDFSRGIVILSCEEFSTTAYDESVDAALYQMTCLLRVDTKYYDVGIELWENEKGYGISYMSFILKK